MGKIVFWVGVVAVVWAAIRFASLVQRRQDGAGRPGGKATARRSPAQSSSTGEAGERMLRCARCGLYFPASEAVRRGADTYCCAEHADAPR